MATVTLQGVKSGAFDYQNQTTNYHTTQTVEYGAGQFLCVMFEELPAAYHYKEITSIGARFYIAGKAISSIGYKEIQN